MSQCQAFMTLRKNTVNIGLNLIATGIAWYWKGPYAGLIVAGIGFVLVITAALFFKESNPTAPPPIHQDNKQNIDFKPNMQQNVYVGTHPPENVETVRENARRETMIIEYLKKTPNLGYDVKELSEVANIGMPDVREIMERLEARKVVWSTGSLDAFGGKSYHIDPLHIPNPQPPEPRKPNTATVYHRLTPEIEEGRVLEFLKTNDPVAQRRMRGSPRFNEAEIIARELGFEFRNTCDALERLEKRGRVRRTKANEPRDGALWALDDRED